MKRARHDQVVLIDKDDEVVKIGTKEEVVAFMKERGLPSSDYLIVPATICLNCSTAYADIKEAEDCPCLVKLFESF